MLENDFKALLARPRDNSLDRLESDIWAGVARYRRAGRAARRMVIWQSGFLALAILASAAAGAASASKVQAQENAHAMMAGTDLSPSSLLLGNRP